MYSVFFINNVVDIRGVCSAPFTSPLRLRGVTEVGIRAIGYKELGCLQKIPKISPVAQVL